MIQAIETSYKGCRFRSRLEARYAVFFDALGIEWQYEPQGFEIKRYNHDYCDNEGQGSCEVECVCPKSAYDWRYLPDFYLPAEMCWVEVKGDMSKFDAEMFTHMIDWGGQIPHVGDSSGTTRGVLVLGDIPEPPKQLNSLKFCHELVVHPLIQHSKGVSINGAAFGFDYEEKQEHESQPPARDGYQCKWIRKQLRVIDYEFGSWDQGDSSCGSDITVGETSVKKMIGEWQWSPYPFSETPSGYAFWKAAVRQAEAYRAARSARFEHGESGAPK